MIGLSGFPLSDRAGILHGRSWLHPRDRFGSFRGGIRKNSSSLNGNLTSSWLSPDPLWPWPVWRTPPQTTLALGDKTFVILRHELQRRVQFLNQLLPPLLCHLLMRVPH